MTQRDAAANNVTPLLSLASPRSDAPATLPDPAQSGVGGCPSFSCSGGVAQSLLAQNTPTTRPQDPVDDGNLPGVLQSALRCELALAPERRAEILARFSQIRTRAEATAYLDEVRPKANAAKPLA
jgi:phospholipase C